MKWIKSLFGRDDYPRTQKELDDIALDVNLKLDALGIRDSNQRWAALYFGFQSKGYSQDEAESLANRYND